LITPEEQESTDITINGAVAAEMPTNISISLK
jgi:hypothetical protein